MQKAGQIAQKLFNACKQEGSTFSEVLSKCGAHEASDDQDIAAGANAQIVDEEAPVAPQAIVSAASGIPKPCRVKSERAVRYGMSEADLLFIKYAQVIFEQFDQDKSGHCHPSEVRRGLTYFN